MLTPRDGCGTPFAIKHTLDCCIGGLLLIILMGRQLADVPRGHNSPKNLAMYNSYIAIIILN